MKEKKKKKKKKLGDIETIDCAVSKKVINNAIDITSTLKANNNDVKRVKVGMSLRVEARKPAS